MDYFPKMIFKVGGPHEFHGGKFDYKIVGDAGELELALADGWHESTDSAKAAEVKSDDAQTEAPAKRGPGRPPKVA